MFWNLLEISKKFPISDTKTRCLKITVLFLFNIASEASYVYILSGQKFSNNMKSQQNNVFIFLAQKFKVIVLQKLVIEN